MSGLACFALGLVVGLVALPLLLIAALAIVSAVFARRVERVQARRPQPATRGAGWVELDIDRDERRERRELHAEFAAVVRRQRFGLRRLGMARLARRVVRNDGDGWTKP